MPLLLLLALTFRQPAISQTAAAKEKVSLNISSTSLDEVLVSLGKQSSNTFSYDRHAARQITVTNLHYNNAALGDVLAALRQQAGIVYVYDQDERNFSVRINAGAAADQPQQQPEKKSRVSGKVIDAESGEPVPGVTIRINNTAVVSGADGEYAFTLPAGRYTAEVSHVAFVTKRITGVNVKDGQPFTLNISMQQSSKRLREVVITQSAARETLNALLAKQKNNAAISDGISAEEIARTPDNNVAQVLKRVSGIQISDDNKFVVVRGLGERYNNVLLNGSQLPSSEPNRRNFAFDMVPSALVDNVIVNKTATPDLPGEFSGGLVQINTRDIPHENFFQLNAGLGYNSRATGKDFISLPRGSSNYLGFADNTYKSPEGISFAEYNDIAYKLRDGSASADERARAFGFLGTLPNTWKMQRFKGQPIQSYGATLGRSIPIGDNRLGVVAALTYRNEQLADQYDLYLPTVRNYQGSEYSFVTLWGGNLNAGYSFGKHKLSLQNTYNRRFSDKLYRYTGSYIMINQPAVSGYTNQTFINELFQTRLAGEHAFGNKGIKVDWNADRATMHRNQPFSRLMLMVGADTPNTASHLPAGYYSYVLSDIASIDAGNLFYSKLTEERYSWAANIQLPFSLLQRSHLFKTGYMGSYRKADYGADLYRVLTLPEHYSTYEGMPYHDVFNTSMLSSGENLYLYPVTGIGTDGAGGRSSGYSGEQRLHAVYGMLDIKPLPKLRLIGGVRVEMNEQQVGTRYVKADNTWADSLVRINKTNWLPSINAIYSITSKVNVRAAYYETLARPDFREISDFQYFDFDILRVVYGGNLQPTQVRNYDVRFEYYPGPGEVLSVSGFYKRFRNPIEPIFTSTSGLPNIVYHNLEKAEDIGFEIDVRKSLNFIDPRSTILQSIFLSGNFTWLDANVDFRRNDAVDPTTGEYVNPTRNRPLYGQSPYIINGGITYTGQHLGINVGYNRYGKRIVAASPNSTEDEYENPRDMMDLQLSYRFLKEGRAEIKLNASNLLNQELIVYKNQFGPNARYPERSPSVPFYPGEGDELPADQLDPKGTSYNKDYDAVISRRINGRTFMLNLLYRF